VTTPAIPVNLVTTASQMGSSHAIIWLRVQVCTRQSEWCCLCPITEGDESNSAYLRIIANKQMESYFTISDDQYSSIRYAHDFPIDN
jgi:hypothetical protein